MQLLCIFTFFYEFNTFLFCRSDLAYFDGLSETILSAGLVKPKPGNLTRKLYFYSVFKAFSFKDSFFLFTGIFQEHIKFLLCLTTPVDVVLLGVSFSDTRTAGKKTSIRKKSVKAFHYDYVNQWPVEHV